MNSTLIIIPCGRKKIWSRHPHLGAVQAKEAYIGPPFLFNKRYAETFATRWLILSAKQGLLEPTTEIEDYDITFKKLSTTPIAIDTLKRQAGEMNLHLYRTIIGLGGAEYRARITEIFTGREVIFPFAGLPLGLQNQAIKRAVEAGRPY